MANWTMITIEHNYNVEYIDVPFEDALFRDKSNQAHSSINEIITRQGETKPCFLFEVRETQQNGLFTETHEE